ncbi:glycosyltransferase family 2 protein [Zestomonas carbonaria]|uniref:Undecaprenyl-phosphate 4-deoxy-4-formamido-L-arabinose transferase n=1 Tax=Zestomonas carbonaria TaxID=2762745 RepID=A0A7U7EMA6_9GAMM|nr:glycosyltransferase family 2 protein [Pseudomonas carbonaria]CAD5107047.1 Undecaprenyl-phosphate 4-deoxy-4-formamido-L-arabinose transferase [Pseudomonas carbonaria]
MSRLSVLIPVYNAAPYLKETLESLFAQTRPADQIVVINDGSTDQSLELLQQLQSKEQRIQLIDQENAGVSAARNRGLAVCDGDFIALMDADDICLPERFALQLETMQAQRLDICGSWLRTFGRSEREVRYPCDDAELKWNYLFLGRTLPNPTVMMRRAALGEVRYREGLAFAEDYGFFLDVFLSDPTIRMGNIPQTLLNYRTHAQQASQRLQERNQDAIVGLLLSLLPKVGIQASTQQLHSHYQIWQQRKALSSELLQDYLPLMSKLAGWLSQQTGDKRLATLHWATLAKYHKALGKEARASIEQAAGADWPLWRRMIERLAPPRL